jgi:hypothetical protein
VRQKVALSCRATPVGIANVTMIRCSRQPGPERAEQGQCEREAMPFIDSTMRLSVPQPALAMYRIGFCNQVSIEIMV